MSIIIFYEKPGCATNRKQKKLLRDSGYRLVERNLLHHGMSKKELYSFVEDRPVSEWFNPNAPQIKKGSLNPDSLSKEEALELIFAEPILIKRPLMLVNKERVCGFEQEKLPRLMNKSFDLNMLQTCSSHHENCNSDRRNVS